MFDLEQMLQITMVGCYRLMGMGVLFFGIFSRSSIIYTVGLKLKVCYHIFFHWIYWVKLGHTSRYSGSIEESLATHRESLQSRQWRSFQCGGRVWGTPVFLDVLDPLWILRKQHKYGVFVWVNMHEYAMLPCLDDCIHKYRILEMWHCIFQEKMCMGLLPAFLQTSCDTVCKLPYSTFCNVTDIVLQYDIIHNSNLQTSMFYKASYPRVVKDIRIVLGPRSWVSKNISNSRFAKKNPISVQCTFQLLRYVDTIKYFWQHFRCPALAFQHWEDIKPFYMKGNGAFAKGEKIPKTKLKLDCPGANSFQDMAQKRVLKKKWVKVCLMFFFGNRSFVKKVTGSGLLHHFSCVCLRRSNDAQGEQHETIWNLQ